MSDIYTNPDSPNPDVSAAMLQQMMMGGNTGMGYSQPTTGYYPGTGYNPFGNNYSPDSRANIGSTYPTSGYPQPVQPTQMPVQSAPAFNALAEQQNGYGMSAATNPTWTGMAMQQPQQYPITPYSGYPIGVEPNDYIYEYMRGHAQTKTTWGENYWTTPKPIDPPMIDWTPKQPQQIPNYTTDPYTGYGYGNYGMPVPQNAQPALPQNFGFPSMEESWLDKAKKNWKNL